MARWYLVLFWAMAKIDFVNWAGNMMVKSVEREDGEDDMSPGRTP